MPPVRDRDLRCDILKAIGLLFIILAHTIRDSGFFEFTNFNVPLMVIASGMLFDKTNRDRSISGWQYLRKRIPRLILPVWCFLIFFFILAYGVSLYEGKSYRFSPMAVLQSFAFISSPGIDFVWIIRVFVLVAIVSPLLLKFKQRCAGTLYFPIAILGLYTLYEFWLTNLNGAIEKWLSIPVNSATGRSILNYASGAIREIWVYQILFFLLPYACLFAVGMMFPNLKNRSIFAIFLIFLGIFLALTSEFGGAMVPLQTYKYPPRIYYLSYGIAISSFLYWGLTWLDRTFPKFLSTSNPLTSGLVFFSSSTLWIYLWHDVFLRYSFYVHKFLFLPDFFWKFPFQFLLVVILSVGITYLQKQIVAIAIAKTAIGQQHARLLTTLFLK